MTNWQDDTEEPTQAVTPDAEAEHEHDDPREGDPEMTDPVRAAESEFGPVDAGN